MQISAMREKYTRPHKHERVQAVERMKRAWEAERDALATVRHFNAKLSAKGYSWFWPKITTAITGKHPWLVIVCTAVGRSLIWVCALSRAIPKRPYASRFVTFAVRAAMVTEGRGF